MNDIDAMMEMYYECVPLAEIGRAFGISKDAAKRRILRHRHKHGLPLANYKKGVKEAYDDTDIIVELYLSGLSVNDIAEKYAVSKTTIRAILDKAEVYDRPSGELKNLESISMDNLKRQWLEIEGPTVVTVGRVPRFIITPIAKSFD